VGNTTNRNVAGKPAQTLNWDAEGKLDTLTEAGNVKGDYTYTADGDRLIRKEGSTTTAYLPGFELTAKGTTVTATRYYSFAGKTVATRTALDQSGVNNLVADHHNTAEIAVNGGTNQAVRRYHDPYGDPRDTTSAPWVDDKGFLGKPTDTTGLTHIGARYYDPQIGRFISVDPIMDLADPQQWQAYAYANNTPVTMSDPTGLIGMRPDGMASNPTKSRPWNPPIQPIPPRPPVSTSSGGGGSGSSSGGSSRSGIGGQFDTPNSPLFPTVRYDQFGPRFEGALETTAVITGVDDLWKCSNEVFQSCVWAMAGMATFGVGKFGDEALDVTARAADDIGAAVIEAAQKGKWQDVTESMSTRARAYQERVTGRSSDQAYVVQGVKFDGYRAGVLEDAKGPGYAQFVDKNGDFQPFFNGQHALVDQARRQVAAAQGDPIRWMVAEPTALEAMRRTLTQNGISGIDLQYKP
jgi:RHS repeat-associated protein